MHNNKLSDMQKKYIYIRPIGWLGDGGGGGGGFGKTIRWNLLRVGVGAGGSAVSSLMCM